MSSSRLAPAGALLAAASLPLQLPRIKTRLGRVFRSPLMVLAAVVIVLYCLAFLFAPGIARFDPLDMAAGPRLYPPNIMHWMGTDEYGRDVFSRVVYGARIALTVGASAALIAAVIGSLLGILAGYFGGILDRLLSIVIDMIFAFPATLLAIALAVFLSPSVRTVVLAITFVQSPHFGRVVRGATIGVKSQQYIEAARVSGASSARILSHHVFPNVVAPLIIQLALSFSYAVLAESSLSFIGVGNPPPAPSWGAMLTGAYGYAEQAPWAAIFPGLAITMLILSFNVLGDGLRDVLDPSRR
jgi:peptide/nickel transport system permease protein